MRTTKLSMLTLVNKHNRKPFCEPSETTLWLRKCQIDLVMLFVLVVVVVACGCAVHVLVLPELPRSMGVLAHP